MKTRLNDEDLNGRCSHLKNYPEKFHIAECCITDRPEGLRHSDFPKRELLQNSILFFNIYDISYM